MLQHQCPLCPPGDVLYNVEVWSILHEQDTCVMSLMELEEVLAVEELTDEEEELAQAKVHYEAKRGQVAHQQQVIENRDKGKDEGEDEEDEDEPLHSLGLSAKVKGKHPVK